MSPPLRFTKAPGHSRNAGSYCTLFFGEHQLLQVSSLPTREDYDHLFYRDICAIFVLQSKAYRLRLGLCIVITIGAIFFGLMAGISNANGGYLSLTMVLGVPSFIIALNDLLRGPSCECFAITAVQCYRLYPWNRLRLAKRGAALLRERVMREQGK
jgi:hypothetical protein